jgi:predicted phosphodiesterase
LPECLGARLPEFWWRDPAHLRNEYDTHGSFVEIAHAHGVTVRTLGHWWGRHRLPELKRGPAAAPHIHEGDDWLLSVLAKLGDNATVEDIADAADVAPRRVRDSAAALEAKGYRLRIGDTIVVDKVVPERSNLHPALFDGEQQLVGVVSDTHLGAKEEALDELHLAYDIFAREGVEQVWHTGDIGTGVGMFRTHHAEANVHTLDEQVDYIVDHYPERPGIVTRLIGGNHDLEGQAGKAGFDIAAAASARRDDLEYLGPYNAWLETRPGTGRWVHLLHGAGGMSYAYSYKAQKIVDGYPSGRKPSLLIVGHWHVRGSFRTRDVEVMFPGCFEWQSRFLARLGLQPAVGFHLLELTVADDGSIVRFRPEWFPYYPGRAIKCAA